ncbi:MAG: sugar kinase [Treponemataceae bacterium]|nr:sugar kinase [Treponemataceae bacterium]
MGKIVTFGEIMLRLAPQGYLRFLQEPEFQATFGGGEANVAVSLANFGMNSSFVTKLPDNDISQACINQLRGFGVDTSSIALGGERMGIYYLEKGASMRPSKVIYDRAHSSISTAAAEDFDWSEIFNGASWFHFTGITPALSESCAKRTFEAVTQAKKAGLTVSCDLNYRKKLWTKEEANKTMSQLCNSVDVCIANEEDASDVFGITASGTDVTSGKLNKEGYIEVAEKLVKKCGFKTVAITLRESISANDNNWGAMLYTDGKAYFSKTYPVRIVDRVGGGDSFGAGLIYALSNNYESQDAIEFAVAASALKHTIEGDFNRVSVKEVETLKNGNASGRVQR